jgi:hypothetical protein
MQFTVTRVQYAIRTANLLTVALAELQSSTDTFRLTIAARLTNTAILTVDVLTRI